MNTIFDFHFSASILFGPQRSLEIGRELSHLKAGSNRKVVIIADPGLDSFGLLDPIKKSLTDAGFEYTLYKEVKSDPSCNAIDDATAAIRKVTPTAVIGIGGGSALDTAKFATVLAALGEKAESFSLKETPIPKNFIPMILIPTTAGTGAEVSRTVVFSDSRKRKVWTWGSAFIAECVILDPALTASLPKEITAMTGMDAMVHGIEASTGQRTNAFAQAFGMRAVDLVARYIERAMDNPGDMEARSGLLAASTMAGMAIDQCGTGIAHAFGHALGTLAGIPHGRAVALSMDAAFSLNARKCTAPFFEVGRALGVLNFCQNGNANKICSETEIAKLGADRFHALLDKIGLKLSVHEDGLSEKDLKTLIEAVHAPENSVILDNNCYMPTEDELKMIGETILGR